jgi:hypothetical protein
MANHFWDTMLTHEYEPKPGSKRYGVIPLSVYNTIDNKYRYNLCSIHRPLKEGEDPIEDDSEYLGRKLRQSISKDEKNRLEKFGSLSYKSAGARRKKNSDDETGSTVKEDE